MRQPRQQAHSLTESPATISFSTSTPSSSSSSSTPAQALDRFPTSAQQPKRSTSPQQTTQTDPSISKHTDNAAFSQHTLLLPCGLRRVSFFTSSTSGGCGAPGSPCPPTDCDRLCLVNRSLPGRPDRCVVAIAAACCICQSLQGGCECNERRKGRQYRRLLKRASDEMRQTAAKPRQAVGDEGKQAQNKTHTGY